MSTWQAALTEAAKAINALPFATPRAKRAVKNMLTAFRARGYEMVPSNPSQGILRELDSDASPFLKYKAVLERARKEMPL